jgi:S-(hydroxymethyl)glutathione dehydrogenase/alcohol dehydrogenase
MKDVPGIVLADLHQLPTVETVRLRDLQPDEVLIRIEASGICHTDIGYMQYARACPVILGHEGAGVVEAVGSDITHTQPGDHVVINWQPKCGECKRCLAGQRDLCENIRGTSPAHIFWQDEPLNVMLNAGTFSPYVIVRGPGAVPIRKDMPLEKAALLGCAVATGVGAAMRTAEVQPGEDVVVWGAGGGVGLSVVQGARLSHAGKIIAIDLHDDRLELAKKMGATHGINAAAADPVEAIRDITGGRGVEHVFCVVGEPALMAQGIEALSRGGALTIIGAAGRQAELTFKPRRFMSQQQKILGCIFGNIRPEIDLPLFADWYMDGRLMLDEMHTHTVSLDNVPGVFDDVNTHGPSGIRTVIRMEHDGV